MDKKSLKVVDLFAGCGGLSLGLEQAGFVPVFVNELNDDARATYIQNRVERHEWLAEPGFHASDVKGMVLDKKYLPALEKRLKDTFAIEHGELDLLVGGPPCQGFSGIGHRRSYSVDKEQLPSNHLYQDMAAIIHRLRPRAFLFENVRGLLNSRWTSSGTKGEIWRDVFDTYRAIPGYTVSAQLVFAKDYGVPQNRPRVLLVGVRNDVGSGLKREGKDEDAIARGYLPAPAPGSAPDLVDLLGDLIDPDYVNGGKTLAYPHSAKTAIQKQLRTPALGGAPLKKGAPVTEHEYSKHNPTIVAKFKAMHETGGIVPEQFKTKKFAQRLLPARWGSSGPTITATSLADDYVHFAQPRTLTVREWARLQMFPDWYQFAGKRTTGGIRRAGNPREGIFDREVPKYTQIGNAVPVGLARAVGNHLARMLEKM
ncbi:DNA-cytosine methyltransferase [Pseudoxanthomonas suwonensis 11-1]|uniref:Cytosine-specific methyltransferase n=1 Tax=Pseudoxanthomonas suwonensis (strain 11-1) TaxID=743721 RepID=E6WV32_PSEUU|nr:DNA cytosine methyltransferase [Pseudoxanthomonas suwonensis]ADV28031.1 DNA-cytosine methyltransferase [Pseudoxanthomonas suwonensis 11-1]